MNAIKSAVVIVLLLAVIFGVYTVLHKPNDLNFPNQVGWQDASEFDPPNFDKPVVELGSSNKGEAFVSLPEGTAAESPASPGVLRVDAKTAHEIPQRGAAGSFPTTPSPLTSMSPAADGSTGGVDHVSSNRFVSPEHKSSGGSGSRDFAHQAHATELSASDPSAAGMATADMAAAQDPRDAKSPATDVGAIAFKRAVAEANGQIKAGQLHAALASLTVFYHSDDLSADEREQLLGLLDPLAGRVVYSTESFTDADIYTVRGRESLMEIAAQYKVPWELLRLVNGVNDPQIMLPGTELKVMRGPFRAEIDLKGASGELTLFVGPYYAGRFQLAMGNDPTPVPGEYQVVEKLPGKAWYSGTDSIPERAAGNPYGDVWIDLGRGVCLHGSPASASGSTGAKGCLRLSSLDAVDVMSILSVGSPVVIRSRAAAGSSQVTSRFQ